MSEAREPKAGGIYRIVCSACGHEVSGPNAKSVREAHWRHEAKTKHRALFGGVPKKDKGAA